MLLEHKPAEFSGVEKRVFTACLRHWQSSVENCQSPPLGTQGVLIMLLPLLQGLTYTTTAIAVCMATIIRDLGKHGPMRRRNLSCLCVGRAVPW